MAVESADATHQSLEQPFILDYEFHKESYLFELQRKGNLTNHGYWIIGINIVLASLYGYIWTIRLPNRVFSFVLLLLAFLWLISMVLAIIVAWPRRYATLEGSDVWRDYCNKLQQHYKNYPAQGVCSEKNLKQTLIDEMVKMEVENREKNDFRQDMWSLATKITIAVALTALLLVVIVNYKEVSNTFKLLFEGGETIER